MRNSTVLRGPSESCPVIVSSRGAHVVGWIAPQWAEPLYLGGTIGVGGRIRRGPHPGGRDRAEPLVKPWPLEVSQEGSRMAVRFPTGRLVVGLVVVVLLSGCAASASVPPPWFV